MQHSTSTAKNMVLHVSDTFDACNVSVISSLTLLVRNFTVHPQSNLLAAANFARYIWESYRSKQKLIEWDPVVKVAGSSTQQVMSSHSCGLTLGLSQFQTKVAEVGQKDTNISRREAACNLRVCHLTAPWTGQ